MKRRTTQQKNDMINFISKNLHLSNISLAKKFNMTVWGIERIMQRNNIKRTKDQIRKLKIATGKRVGKLLHEKYNFYGKDNPNWKGGISTNHYHYKKIQKKRYPEKIKAREKVHYAVKTGRLIKGKCEFCNEIKTFAHHEDYLKPLEVKWLCRKHHRAEHGNRY